MKRLMAVIEYDGTDFSGWQVQKNHRTVQGVCEAALRRRFGRSIKLTGAGRTDAGVHALGQVAHFNVPEGQNVNTLLRTLNALFPEDVSLRSLEAVRNDFNARFDAVARSYRYVICRTRSVLQRRYCWEVGGALSIASMRTAMTDLLGTHDFKPFAKLDANKTHYRCTVFETALNRRDDRLVFTVRADRFLHGMVRAIVGVLVDIGRGAKDRSLIRTILQTGDRTLVSSLAPAKGLVLEQVYYSDT